MNRHLRVLSRVARVLSQVALSALLLVGLAREANTAPQRSDATQPHPKKEQAPEKRWSAKELYQAGVELLQKRQYRAAYENLQDSYRKNPLPLTEYVMAKACFLHFDATRKRVWITRAIALYQQAMQKAPRAPWVPTAKEELSMAVARKAALPPAERPLPPAPKTQLMVTSATKGARIQIDGFPSAGEPAPMMQVVAPGPHRISVVAPGHEPTERTVRAVEKRLIRTHIDLVSKPGRLRVLASQDRATVFLNGKAVAHTPAELSAVAPGDYRVAIGARGHKLWQTTLRVQSERTTMTMANLTWTPQRKAAVAVAGVGAALVVAGAITGVLGLQTDASFDTSLPPAPTTGDAAAWDAYTAKRRDWDDRLARRDALGTATVVLLSTAAAAATVSLFLWLFDSPTPPLARSASKVVKARSVVKAGVLEAQGTGLTLSF
jgi:hypothetical protein